MYYVPEIGAFVIFAPRVILVIVFPAASRGDAMMRDKVGLLGRGQAPDTPARA